MSFDPDDVERLLTALEDCEPALVHGRIVAFEPDIEKPGRQRKLDAVASAYKALRTPKRNERVVPPYPLHGDYQGISFRDVHSWLTKLESKLNAVLEQVEAARSKQ